MHRKIVRKNSKQPFLDIIVTQITTLVFGNVATVTASCKTLHWMQMADGSNVF